MGSIEWRVAADPPAEAVAMVAQVLQRRAVLPVYQPIVDLGSRQIVGVEALARGPAGTPVESPEALLAASAKAGMLALVDQLCFARAVEIALRSPHLLPPLLFVNAEPVVVNESFAPGKRAAARSEWPFRVVMEYTERGLATRPQALLRVASLVRHDGNALALDDVGADPASLAFLPLLAPEVVKLDLRLLREPSSRETTETAAIVNAYARSSGAMVLAEGIETAHDVATARALGARWGQGWLFGRPGPLTAITGRPLSVHSSLPPFQPDTSETEANPFAVLEGVERGLLRDGATADCVWADVLATAERGGRLAVIVGGYPDEAVGRTWLALLAERAETAAYVALVGPALPGTDVRRIRLAVPDVAAPAGEAVLSVMAPGDTIAVCLRRRPGGGIEYAVTHDPDLVRTVTMMLMRRFETAVDDHRR